MGYGYRILEQNYECNLIKYNVKFYTKPILSFLDFPVVSWWNPNARILHQLCKVLFTSSANSLKLVFSFSYAGSSLHLLSEGCACFGECLWEVVCVETFVRVLCSSRVNLTKRKWYKRVSWCLDQKPFILFLLQFSSLCYKSNVGNKVQFLVELLIDIEIVVSCLVGWL